MKRLLLWLIGVALGVVVLLAAVLGVSYSFTSEGAKPVPPDKVLILRFLYLDNATCRNS